MMRSSALTSPSCRCRCVVLLLSLVFLSVVLSSDTQGRSDETRDPEREVQLPPRAARAPGPGVLEWLLRADWLDAYRRPGVPAAMSRDHAARAGAHNPSLINWHIHGFVLFCVVFYHAFMGARCSRRGVLGRQSKYVFPQTACVTLKVLSVSCFRSCCNSPRWFGVLLARSEQLSGKHSAILFPLIL